MRTLRNSHIAALLLLLLMAFLAGGAARHESVTFDEIAHTGAGVSYLQRLDMRMNEEHPPLAKVVAALPLVVRGVHADYSHLSWTLSGKMFYQFLGEWVFGDFFLIQWNDLHSTLLWARAPMLLMTLLLGFVIYRCGSLLGGNWGGLLCLSAFVTTPAFLAFGPLVVTDIALTLFWILVVWQIPQMWLAPTRGTVVKFGLALAGALLSKFSSGLLFFVFLGVALSLRWKPLAEQPTQKYELHRWRRRAWRNFAEGTLWAAFFVYLTYFLLSWNQPTDSFSIIPHFPASIVLRRLLMPPWLYFRGLLVFALSAGSRPTFILGHSYPHGVWFYFPALFFLKSQLAFLVLLLIAAMTGWFAKRRSDLQSLIPEGIELHWRAVWVSLVVFTGACMLNRLDISIRHFTVALALTCLLLAPLPRALQQLRVARPQIARFAGYLTIALAIASLITATRAYPNYLPYLNALGLGRPGYTLVNDSNLDWNQALPAAETFVRQRGMKQILLDQYGFADPTAYIPEAVLWDCQQPEGKGGGQWALVSANFMIDSGNCIWLMQYPHEALAGGSMYAVQLPAVIPTVGQPGGPPTSDTFRYIAGMKDFDSRAIFANIIRDPTQFQPTMDRFQAEMEKMRKKKSKN